MSSFDCPHGMVKAASCIDCMYDGPVAPPSNPSKELEVEVVTRAKFEQHCPTCQTEVRLGELIGKTEKGWLCAGCCNIQERVA